jgi:hypothetical protein
MTKPQRPFYFPRDRPVRSVSSAKGYVPQIRAKNHAQSMIFSRVAGCGSACLPVVRGFAGSAPIQKEKEVKK